MRMTVGHGRKPRRIASVILALTFTNAQPAAAAPQNPCPLASPHFRVEGNSGRNNFLGSGTHATTWNSWSLGGRPRTDHAYSNQTVWAIQGSQPGDVPALEVGFNTGAGDALTGVYSDSMYPYFTLSNGLLEFDCTAISLPPSTIIWNSATSDGTYSYPYVNGVFLPGNPGCPGTAGYVVYGVSPALMFSYEQTENDYQDTWMGGGGTNPSWFDYQDMQGKWNKWGYIQPGITPSSGSPFFQTLDPLKPNQAYQGGWGRACR